MIIMISLLKYHLICPYGTNNWIRNLCGIIMIMQQHLLLFITHDMKWCQIFIDTLYILASCWASNLLFSMMSWVTLSLKLLSSCWIFCLSRLRFSIFIWAVLRRDFTNSFSDFNASFPDVSLKFWVFNCSLGYTNDIIICKRLNLLAYWNKTNLWNQFGSLIIHLNCWNAFKSKWILNLRNNKRIWIYSIHWHMPVGGNN